VVTAVGYALTMMGIDNGTPSNNALAHRDTESIQTR